MEKTPQDVLVVEFNCTVCGKRATRTELSPPGVIPPSWPSDDRYAQLRDARRKSRRWWLIYEGIERGSGVGGEVDTDEVQRILAIANDASPSMEAVRRAGYYDNLGFCLECAAPYCWVHWSVSVGGYGVCPRGHGKSLDPHWSPDDYD